MSSIQYSKQRRARGLSILTYKIELKLQLKGGVCPYHMQGPGFTAQYQKKMKIILYNSTSLF